MKEEIYKSIIQNSKIAYLKINCKKDCHNKFNGIEVIEQNKEFEKLFKVITGNNILNREITALIINRWINKKFNNNEFDELIREVIDTGHKRLKYKVDLNDKKVITDIYYLDDYFILIYNIDYNLEDRSLKIYNWKKDLNGVYLDLSHDYKDIFNTEDSIVGLKDVDIWGEEEINQFRANEQEVISSGNVKTFFQVLNMKNGEKLYLESTIWPLLNEDNDIIGTEGYCIEINDKLVLEKNIEQNEENFREITKYCDSAFIIRDEKRATYVSPGYRNIFESDPDDLYKDIDKLNDFFKSFECGGHSLYYNYDFSEPNEGTEKIKLNNGKEKWIWYKFLPIRNRDGKVIKRVGILTDITQRRNIEDEKIQVKMDFFADVSHELRTPINLISSTIQLIKLNLNKLSPQDANKFEKYIEMMEMNTLRLVRLVDNLIDSSKADAGSISYSPINSDIIAFVEDTCDSIVGYAESNKMNLIFDTDSEEEIVLFDPDIIERILLNLLSNAIKFNKVNGNIYVNVITNNEQIIISVKDEGVGIPKDKLDFIFDRFEQVHNKNKKTKQGSGIGLYLVKTLTQLHGGSVRVESEVNKGSEFIVSIPKKVLKDKDQHIQTKEHEKYRRVNIEFSDI